MPGTSRIELFEFGISWPTSREWLNSEVKTRNKSWWCHSTQIIGGLYEIARSVSQGGHVTFTMTLMDVSDEAETFKEEANQYFKDGDYKKAIEAYTKAIEVRETAVYLANRSLAYLRIECFGSALDDASRALELDSNYVKVVRVAPSDKTARLKLTECQKIVRRKAFEKAIALEEQASPLESFDPASVSVDDSYKGPHLEQNADGKYNVTESFMLALMEHFKSEKVLHKKYAMIIMKEVYLYFRKLPSLVDIDVPEDTKFTVCGDIHGQFYDLMNIFEINGLPSKDNPYLFNGDFVDRGSFSVECIFTLFGFKLLYPDRFYLSRGNHESEHMNRLYGFEGEVKSKYSAEMANMFTDIFNWLPLAHLINGRILVMHGGLFARDNVTIDEIRKVSRNHQPDDDGIMCELLWSDPMEGKGRAPSKRGIGCQFGQDITERFCELNGLDYIIRSHEVKEEGYEVAHDGRCVTVFSAPNYCDTMHNRGAFITLKGSRKPGCMKPKFTSFKEVPHPRVRPMAYVNPLLSMFM